MRLFDVEACVEDEEEDEEEGRMKGATGVDGLGAAAGAESKAERAFNCVSDMSRTSI
jgi:hypothetical protein